MHSLLEDAQHGGGSTGDHKLAAAAKGENESSLAENIILSRDINVTHSRLLTKQQLADMAWGVRELSKRLGSLRMKIQVRKVFLLTKAHDETLIGYTREMARWLLSTERMTHYTV